MISVVCSALQKRGRSFIFSCVLKSDWSESVDSFSITSGLIGVLAGGHSTQKLISVVSGTYEKRGHWMHVTIAAYQYSISYLI